MTMTAGVEQEIEWSGLQRQRRTIVVVDLVESVRLMLHDEAAVIQRWRSFVNDVRVQVLPAAQGRLVKSLGDGMLLEFHGIPQAVAAALEMQRRIGAQSAGDADACTLRLRVGVHVADVVVDELDVYGAGVNLTARLAGLAEPGEVVVSAPVRDALTDALDATIEDLGECFLKHIDKPERAFRVRAANADAAAQGSAGNATAPADATPSVAVIPLHGPVHDTHARLFGELASDGIIACLSHNGALRVISRLSTSALKNHPRLDAAVSSHLKATYIVSGTCVAHGGRLFMHVELADTRSLEVLWAGRYSCDPQDVMDAQGTVLPEIAQAINAAIFDAELVRIRRSPFPTLATFSLMIGSISLLHRASSDDFERARPALEALIERAPRHGSGYALKAQWHVLRVNRGQSASVDDDLRQARQDSERAVHCDPENPLALTCRGLVLGFLDHDLDGAGTLYERALEINPSEAMAWLFVATLRSWQGRGAESAAAAERALQLSPLDPLRYYYDSLAAVAMLADKRYARSIELARRSLRVNRLHTATYRVLAIAEMLAGDADGARATVRALRQLDPKLTVASYLARYPGRSTPQAGAYADALAAAGLPP